MVDVLIPGYQLLAFKRAKRPLFLKAGRNPEASKTVQHYDYEYDMLMTKMRVVLAMALLNARMVVRFMMMMMMTEVSRGL